MNNVVDSCGWIEYFFDEPNSEFFKKPIVNSKNLIVPSICLHEVYKYLLLKRGEDAAIEAASGMATGRIVSLDEDLALRAAKIGVGLRLPVADSIVLATAVKFDAAVWTQDSHFRELAGVRYVEKRRK